METKLSLDIVSETGAPYIILDTRNGNLKQKLLDAVEAKFNTNKLPMIAVAGSLIGGYFELKEKKNSGELINLLISSGVPNNEKEDFPSSPVEEEDYMDMGNLFGDD
uniref:Uncharacterized protein n=1 Tax=Euplotes harpa TaxID=151035 RepID=A0A7S3N9I4_9SPIT|mmetsp:Transcript_26424/g.30551  ORF Transcript_26424/g.30551 Transcript_26424/m.30551 type:complete len:107 (+) Transcript_26424:92-412(+)